MQHIKTRWSSILRISLGVTILLSVALSGLWLILHPSESFLGDGVGDTVGESQLSLKSFPDGSQGASDSSFGSLSYEAGLSSAEGATDSETESSEHMDSDDAARRASENQGPRQELARARTLGYVLSELSRRQGSRLWHRGSSRHHGGQEEEPEQEEPEFSTIRPYLTDVDETPADVRDVPQILEDPSNIVSESSTVNLLAWDVRNQEPRGSYLYVLQQDLENQISQIHRYFCRERRLDILSETCQPVASVFSDSGVPMAVGYTQEGIPLVREADDLDQSLFSSSSSYVEANEFLIYLQEYIDNTRV